MHLFYSLPTLPASSIRALCCAPGALLKVVTFMNCLLSACLAASMAQPSLTASEREPGEEKQLSPNALINLHGEITVQHYSNPLVLLMAGRQYFFPRNFLQLPLLVEMEDAPCWTVLLASLLQVLQNIK